MRDLIKLLVLVCTIATVQGCAALVGGAAGAGVYGIAESADEDEEVDNEEEKD